MPNILFYIFLVFISLPFLGTYFIKILSPILKNPNGEIQEAKDYNLGDHLPETHRAPMDKFMSANGIIMKLESHVYRLNFSGSLARGPRRRLVNPATS